MSTILKTVFVEMIVLDGWMTNLQLVYINSGEWYRSIESISAEDCRLYFDQIRKQDPKCVPRDLIN